MGIVRYLECGAVIPCEHYDLDDCTFDELAQLVIHYNKMATDTFHEEDSRYSQLEKSALVSYYLNVADRYSREMKDRAILTSI